MYIYIKLLYVQKGRRNYKVAKRSKRYKRDLFVCRGLLSNDSSLFLSLVSISNSVLSFVTSLLSLANCLSTFCNTEPSSPRGFSTEL